jgi:hypothetical protein
VDGREAGLSAPRGTRSSICASDAIRTGVACWAPDTEVSVDKYNAMTQVAQIVFILSFLGDFEAEAVFIGRVKNRNKIKPKEHLLINIKHKDKYICRQKILL